MSSFTITAKHKKSGAVYKVFCIDDFFGRHAYGYSLNDGRDAMTEKAFYDQFERVELTDDN